MKSRAGSPTLASHITIHVAGKLFQGHLAYLDQLVRLAAECQLWPQLDLLHLEELDRAGLLYLLQGENRDFEIVSCPHFVREWIEYEGGLAAA
jgi:hypothetical protein